MRLSKSWPLGLLFVLAVPVVAQGQLPAGMSPEDAMQLLQTRPELGPLLQSRLQSSGLSNSEIRSRLTAAGYPANALDPYLGSDASSAPAPSREALDAANALGIAGFSRQDSLTLSRDTVITRLRRDSLRLDSILREERNEAARPSARLFGLDILRQPTTQFTAVTSGPVDGSYRLGPGDALALIMTGDIERATTLTVTREGFIIIPQVGQIYVNNLSLDQLEDLLYQRLGRAYPGISRSPDARTKFQITVTRVRFVTVRVVGEVSRPGTYQLSATAGVLAAVYEAGGLNERSNFRAVQVRRGSKLVGTVDLYDYLLHGTTSQDIRLDAGDVVYVPVRGARVTVVGEVLRPATYEMRPGEGLRELLDFAGGLTPRAAIGNVTIARTLPPAERVEPGRSQTVVTVDLRSVLDGSKPVALVAEDSVTIFSSRGARTTAVALSGSVWQPGTYRLEPGMRLWDAIRTAGGLRPEAYTGRAQIVRSLPDSSRQMIGVVLDSLAQGENPVLRELDQITIYAKTDFRRQRYIGVYGSVRRPGLVAFSDSMTLRDAVLLAGGTSEDAYLAEAEVSRVRVDRAPGEDSIAVALKVPLDSSFVLDPTGVRAAQPLPASAPQVVLSPYDYVYIRKQPGFEAPRTVVLTGEVQFPGRYTLLSREERLTDLIRRAGGLTQRAYTNGIRFFRQQYSAAAPLGPATPRTVTADQAGLNVATARLGVQLDRVLKDADHKDNLVLAAGDSIFIPTFIPIVRVEGAVNAPTTVTYVPGAGRSYYIDAAGGYNRLANKPGVFIQQPNGIIEKDGKPEPGAVVVVPAREAPAQSLWSPPVIVGLIAQLASAAVTIIAVLRP